MPGSIHIAYPCPRDHKTFSAQDPLAAAHQRPQAASEKQTGRPHRSSSAPRRLFLPPENGLLWVGSPRRFCSHLLLPSPTGPRKRISEAVPEPRFGPKDLASFLLGSLIPVCAYQRLSGAPKRDRTIMGRSAFFSSMPSSRKNSLALSLPVQECPSGAPRAHRRAWSWCPVSEGESEGTAAPSGYRWHPAQLPTAGCPPAFHQALFPIASPRRGPLAPEACGRR